MLRRYCTSFQAPPVLLTAPEKGSTPSWFRRHQPAGECYDVLPFERTKKGGGSKWGISGIKMSNTKQ